MSTTVMVIIQGVCIWIKSHTITQFLAYGKAPQEIYYYYYSLQQSREYQQSRRRLTVWCHSLRSDQTCRCTLFSSKINKWSSEQYYWPSAETPLLWLPSTGTQCPSDLSPRTRSLERLCQESKEALKLDLCYQYRDLGILHYSNLLSSVLWSIVLLQNHLTEVMQLSNNMIIQHL